MPAQDLSKYTASQQWQTAAKNQEQDYTLPSGAVCRVRKPGMEKIITSGLLDMVDSLGIQTEELADGSNRKKKRAAAAKGIKTKQGQDDDFLQKMAKDPKLFDQLSSMVDAITVMTVIIPQVYPIPVQPNPEYVEGGDKPQFIHDNEAREDGHIYVDSIDFMDKMEVMSFAVGDLENLKQFREQSGDAVGAAQSVDGNVDETIELPGD